MIDSAAGSGGPGEGGVPEAGPGSSGSSDTSDVEVAVAAARAGADIVRELYGGRLERVDKGGGDFATAADLAAERAILDVLRAARPGDAVLGEEGGRRGAADADRLWLVDPLCGTLNYAVGTMLVAVNVALRDGAAAVADPFGGEVFHTDGATARVRAGGADSPLVPSAASALVDINLDPPLPAARLLTDPAFGTRFRARVGSTTLALAWVAAGKRAAYVTDGGDLTASLHFAAGIALCRAAGCTLTDLTGAPLGPAARGLIAAADPATHAQLLALVRDSVL
ncbi:inositol monophosphatase family protein [Actinacidiphila alni]|uniref:inositol monophosphatase family protein n=1 Tax=Actinacidiphila alni TaxID=380248 RepID=UPI003452D180